MRRSCTTLAGVLLLLVLAGPAAADPATAAPVYRFADGSTVPRARSALATNDDGARWRLTTSSLPSDHTVTVWLVIFNHPENCTHGEAVLRCGPGDLPPFGGSDAAVTSVVFGAGRHVGSSGRATFAGRLPAGDDDQALFGPGLVNPTGADIHLLVNDGATFGCPATCLQFSPHEQR